eukprot:2233645-Pleurochrysis_carterae.AAC.3
MYVEYFALVHRPGEYIPVLDWSACVQRMSASEVDFEYSRRVPKQKAAKIKPSVSAVVKFGQTDFDPESLTATKDNMPLYDMDW